MNSASLWIRLQNREAGQGRQEWTLQKACGDIRPFTVSSYHTLHGHFSSVSIFCTCQGFHSTKASLKTITFRLLARGQVTIQVHELQHAYGEVTAQLYWNQTGTKLLGRLCLDMQYHPKEHLSPWCCCSSRCSLDIAGNGLSFGKKDHLGCLICNTLDCTGNLSYLPSLRATFFFVHPLQMALYKGTPSSTPKSQGFLGGCMPTMGSAHMRTDTELQP